MRVRVSDVPDPAREVLARDPRATFFFQPEWAEALRAAYPSLIFRYLVLEEDGRITGVLPAVEVPHRLLREVVSMPFGTHGGALSTPEASPAGTRLLHERFVAMLRYPAVFRYELTAYDPPALIEADLLQRVGHDLVRTSVPVLDLAPGEATLWDAYDQRLRRSIRRAGEAGVIAQTGAEHFETFFELYAAQSREWPLPWHHRRERLAKIVASLGDRAGIWVGFFAGEPLCAQLVLYHPNHDMHFWLSGARPESRRHAAFHFLLNAIILDGVRRGFRECHFGSSLGNPGVEHFKLAYGAVPRPLLRFFHQPRWVGWVQRIRW